MRERELSEKTAEERRRDLVREIVAGAILPGLLARKDEGVFDRGPNVLRLRKRVPEG